MKNKTVILAIVFVIIVGSIYYLESKKAQPSSASENNIEETQVVVNPNPEKSQYLSAQELTGISGYLNTEEGLKIADLKGKVVLVDFWTYTCINCIRTLPYLTAWDEKYRDKGLVIIGVHTPEFEFEKEYENVKMAIEDNGIKYAVVQDNDYATWKAYKNRYWPRKYLIDAEGYIRYDHIGEGGYQETELKIQELLAEIGEEANLETEKENNLATLQTTPELYAGHKFALRKGQNLGNEQGLIKDEETTYQEPEEIKSDIIYLEGKWKSNSDDLELTGDSGSIFLSFQASEVNIVAEASPDSVLMEVLVDGEYLDESNAGSDVIFDDKKSFIVVDTPKLYNIFNGEYKRAFLELKAQKSFKFNAFTFGGGLN